MKLFIIIFFCAPIVLLGQFFENIGEINGLDFSVGTPNLGSGVSFFDYDRDGWNDLTFAVMEDSLRLFKNVEGQLVQQPSPFYCSAQAKQINWVDIDNDGDYDLFITQYFGNTTLLENTPDGFVNISQTAGIPSYSDAPTFGASWADYDKDGFLDAYICNYDGNETHANWLLHNNGDGTFEEIAIELGLSNGYCATFQSCWMDYNNDGWPDLHVINDKACANTLYRNNGNGTFSDVSEDTGTDIVMDSMSTTVADYNNDGALDIYITDEPPHNAMLLNESGQFYDVASETGVELDGLSWGAVFIDYDNDLDDDLYVCTTSFTHDFKNVFYVNTGTIFIDASWIGLDDDEHLSYSSAKGDFNNDGINDIVVSNANGDPQDLYLAPETDNHSITVSLEGTLSNRDATGTWLHSFIGENEYVEWTMNGENFLAQESQYEILPLGEADGLDSLAIVWPSGIEEIYYNIPAGSNIELIEGYLPELEIVEFDGVICEGQSITLEATAGFDSYLWSNGDSLQSVQITEPGEYWVQGVYNGGLSVTSLSISLTSTDPAEIEVLVQNPSCFNLENGAIVLSSNIGIASVDWEMLDGDSVQNDLGIGNYQFSLIDSLGCIQVDSVLLSQPDSLWAEAMTTNVSCFGFQDGTSTVSAMGGTGEVTWFWDGIDPMALAADSYMIQGVDENDCEVYVEFEIIQPDALEIEMNLVNSTGSDGYAAVTISGGTEPYSIEWDGFEGDMEWMGLEPGNYSVQITDSLGCTLKQDFEIELVDLIGEFKFETNLYPNPVRNTIHLDLGNFLGEARYSIHTIEGLIVAQSILSSPYEIDVRQLASGNYVLWLHLEGHSQSYLLSVRK